MIDRFELNRRHFLSGCGAAVASTFLPAPAMAKLPTDKALFGLSAFGELKYQPGFTHFEYAAPEAPRGGMFRFQPSYWFFNQSTLTFNTLNSFVLGGDAPPRMELCFDSLMVRAFDEPDALYGLVAESVTISPDRNSYHFKLRPEARFHDGSPLTAQDLAFTYDLLKEKGHPQLRLPLGVLKEAVAEGDHAFRLTFDGSQNDRAILDLVTYPILSKAFYSEHPFDSSQLNAPLGSGPYKVGRYDAGTFIIYDRVADYWAGDLPVNRGLYHFDQIRIDFFRDRNAGFEAFKKGDVEWREEFTSKVWATGYDFPAINDGRVVKNEVPGEKRPDMQAWALNQRRERFQDMRVRQAVSLCYDFAWTNRNFFYGIYERSESPFQKSDFMAEGTPSREELALLEPFRGQIPEEAFGPAVKPPESDGSGRDRNNLQRAGALLDEAGWKTDGTVRRNANGEPLTLEYIVRDEVFVRVETPFIENMRRIGIDASIRLLDASQYQSRVASFDFDMAGLRQSLGGTPTVDGLKQLFHSQSAATEGTRNLPGTRSEAVDSLIDIAGEAQTRADLVIALRALDRVVRARHDWIMQFHSANHRLAYWDIYGFKEQKPDYFFPVEMLWWYDEEKARAIGKA